MIPGSNKDHPSLFRSIAISMRGFIQAFSEERNLKIMVCTGCIAIVLGCVLEIDLVGWAVVLLGCGTVLAAELLNTSIETTVDMISPDIDPRAARVKDFAAAAVWMLCFFVAVAGLMVFIRAAQIKFGL